ncbi:hypothetical protein N7532_012016 [Penicillium argentinense]|uniref:SWI/SNF family DNA-dependent ATPase Ris1 n=1 Tax=Penicillium argentinense TaxID=1131581 RepID=A0A9W9EJL1_9EURO|nr:uncharacterized protein N7532_012016 [Penicillium argentinense]KAJ5082973.1 hypothetical protein N7532_012016 [Penicillium argentinense]
MDSSMASSKDAEVNALIEDLETRKFFYDEDMAHQIDPEQLAKDAEAIKHLEEKVKQLLGDDSPAAELGSHIPPVTPLRHPQAAMSSRTVPTVLSEAGTPTHPDASASNGYRVSSHVSSAESLFPSHAPSPLPNQAGRISGQLSTLPVGSRKRPRDDSVTSPAPQKRQNMIEQSKARMDELSNQLDTKLVEIKRLYEAKKANTEDLQLRATADGKTLDEVLRELDIEQQEDEDHLIREINLERDGAMARKLQAEDFLEDDQPTDSTHPPTATTLPFRDQISLGRPDPYYARGFQPASSISMGYDNPFAPGPSSGALPGRQYVLDRSPFSSLRLDDDIQEVTGDYFHSRFGGRSQGMSAHPLLPPMPQFPFHFGRGPIDVAMTSLDETKIDMEDDEIDGYDEREFPKDIRNLIHGIKDIRDATNAATDETPDALKVTLMKHQKIGLRWMKAKEESNQRGGILADDMGLGKTIQAIALMTARPPTESDRHPCLIVAPKALMEQWRLEILRHVKPGKQKLSVLIFHDKTRRTPWRDLCKKDIIITTYGTLTANHKYLVKAEEMEKEGKDPEIAKMYRDQALLFTPRSKFHRIIIDEAQNIKNPLAKSNKACCAIDATHRWCLTGTPMMNKLDDLQALLRFLRIRPYNMKDRFKRDFPVRPGGMVEEKTMKQLRVLVKSVCLRRTKTSQIDGQPILQLPPKVIEKVHVVFSEKEKAVYSELDAKTQRQITRYLDAGTLGKNYGHVLVLLLRLRQACCHPHLLEGFNDENLATVAGVDLVANAKLLDRAAITRMTANLKAGDGELEACEICMDSAGNSVIYIPCAHYACSECYARISDPAVLARESTTGFVKCQSCRGQVDPNKVTDLNSFKKAHYPGSQAEYEASKQDMHSDSDSDSSNESDNPDSPESKEARKKSLAELRKAGLRNSKAKRRYLDRLENEWIPSSKIEKTLEILQANEDRGKQEKTIVFSQFTSLLDLMEVPLRRRGWQFVRFDGTMNVDDRNASVAAFTDDPEIKVMLVSLKAGNSGLNLVAASHVIIFDPFWNPYVEDQAIDRAHRIGQTRDVFVHRLLVEETVEDRIIELQDQKRELISGALDEGGSMNVSRLSAEDLAFLFGIQHA